MRSGEAIEQHELVHLVEAHALRDVTIVAVPDPNHGGETGYAIRVRFGTAEKVLKRQRGDMRRFRTLDGAAKFVRRELQFTRPSMDLTAMAT